jgi:hypothetical protein
MPPPQSTPVKLPSLADYLVSYDLASMLAEARIDYSESSAGGPRLLNQKDIAARFRHSAPHAPDKAPHDKD